MVVYHSTNHRIRTRTKAQRGLLAYVTFDPRAKGTVNGLPIRPELMLAVEPETEVVFVTDAGHESITLLLPPAEIRAHLRDRRREGDFRFPKGAETLQADGAMVRRVFDCGKRLVDTAARQPALPARRTRAVKERAARCRLPGSERAITLRAPRLWTVVPAEIVVVRPQKQWRYAGHPYLSGEIVSSRLDVAALGLVPLRLEDEGIWSPDAQYWGEEGQPIDEWAKPIVARGPRPMFEMEQVVDAHAHLGNFSFQHGPKEAMRHYEAPPHRRAVAAARFRRRAAVGLRRQPAAPAVPRKPSASSPGCSGSTRQTTRACAFS
jgi:hypothetical protein